MKAQEKSRWSVLSSGPRRRLRVFLGVGAALGLGSPGHWQGGLAQASGHPDGLAFQVELTLGMIEKINDLRRGLGLPLIRSCQSMLAAAKSHTEDMASRGELDHAGSDGSTFWERLCRSGYRPGCGPRAWVGEIIAAGNSGVDDTFDQWVQSPGHYEILVEPGARFAGVGYSKNSGSGLQHFWTVDFGAEGDPSCQ